MRILSNGVIEPSTFNTQQFNNNVDIKNFIMDRFYNGAVEDVEISDMYPIDLSTCKAKIRVNNPDDIVELGNNLTITNLEGETVAEDDDLISLNWIITNNITRYAGKRQYQIEFYNDNNTLVFRTRVMNFVVNESLDSEAAIIETAPSLIEEWENRLNTVLNQSNDFNTYADNKINEKIENKMYFYKESVQEIITYSENENNFPITMQNYNKDNCITQINVNGIRNTAYTINELNEVVFNTPIAVVGTKIQIFILKAIVSDSVDLNTLKGDKGDPGKDSVEIIDNLTSTDTDKALSANMGKELNNKVDNEISAIETTVNSLASGSPKGVYTDSAALKAANPDTGVYIATSNGHIYSWTKNQSGDPIDLGVYQATGITDGSITNDMLADTTFDTCYDDWSQLTRKADATGKWGTNKIYSRGYIKRIKLHIDATEEKTGELYIFKKITNTTFNLYETFEVSGFGDVYVNIDKFYDFDFIIVTKIESLSYADGTLLDNYEYNSSGGWSQTGDIYTFTFNAHYAFAVGIEYYGIKEEVKDIESIIKLLNILPEVKIMKNKSKYPITFDFETNKAKIEGFIFNYKDKHYVTPITINSEIDIPVITDGCVYFLLYNVNNGNITLKYCNSGNYKENFVTLDLKKNLCLGFVYRYSSSSMVDIKIGSINTEFINVINKQTINTDVTTNDDLIIPKFGERSIINIENMYSQWFGKTINCIGDSVTKGENKADGYKRMKDDNIASILKEKLGFKISRNYGVGGSRITSHSDGTFAQKGMVDRYTQMAQADIITIWGGTNDFGSNVPMGDLTDLTDNTKFKPAFYNLLNGLLTNYPTAKLLVITPTHRNDNRHPENVTNSQGLYLKDYRDAEIEICEKLGIPYLDMWTELGFTPFNQTQKTSYMPDGLHPNIAGMRIVGDIITHRVSNISPKN